MSINPKFGQAKDVSKQHQHWFMVAGEIVYREKDGTDPYTTKLNTVIGSRDGKLPMIAIGRAQQQLQMQFFRETGNPNLIIGKLIILAIMPLGVMTTEEFNVLPKGVTVTELPIGNA